MTNDEVKFTDDLPCVAIDADGFWWRVWPENPWWSMPPTNEFNEPIPQPVKLYRLVAIE